jgi:cytochrome c oxidase cbb3-type subunit 1
MIEGEGARDSESLLIRRSLMDRYVILFIKTSLISFVVGSALGLWMVIEPSDISYFRSAHVLVNLLGFMAMMIYGVGYHVLPRFSGLTLHSRKLMVVHYYLGTATLAAMALAWVGMEMTRLVDPLRLVLALASAGQLCSIFLFFYNIYCSIKPVAPPQPSQQRA